MPRNDGESHLGSKAMGSSWSTAPVCPESPRGGLGEIVPVGVLVTEAVGV